MINSIDHHRQTSAFNSKESYLFEKKFKSNIYNTPTALLKVLCKVYYRLKDFSKICVKDVVFYFPGEINRHDELLVNFIIFSKF